jgi:L-fuculose-phosphate aldolase
MKRAKSEAELREQICLIGQLMQRNQYVDGASGNISARLDANHVLATPSGLAKGFMTPDQLIVVNLDGKRVDEPSPSNAALRPTSELPMHLECYKQREDIRGVVHAHPPTSIALTVAGYDFSQILIPEMVLLLGTIPTLPYRTPSSSENVELIRLHVHQHNVMMLSFHGSLTVAKHVWDAYLRLENLEHTAKIIYMVQQLGGQRGGLTPEEIEKLLEIREKLGLARPGEKAPDPPDNLASRISRHPNPL